MSEKQERKVLLSLRDVCVKFNVRGRILTAIRDVSLDIYENESIAIVGESGSGKSVLTKTFAGMLETNGFISKGSIIISDEELSETHVKLTPYTRRMIERMYGTLNKYSTLERGAEEYKQILAKQSDLKHVKSLTVEEEDNFRQRLKQIKEDMVELNNYILTLDKKNAEDQQEIHEKDARLRKLAEEEKAVTAQRDQLIRERTAAYQANTALRAEDAKEIEALKKLREEKIAAPDHPGNPHGLTDETLQRNKILAYEVALSIGRYPVSSQVKFIRRLKKEFRCAMMAGEDLNDARVRGRIFQTVSFHVEFRSIDEAAGMLNGYTVIDCAHVKYTKDWQQIRGRRIATVFQDPMTSLNPVIPIGKQIMMVILKHQKCSQAEARQRTIDIMGKVGIPEPEKRFDDYPF